MRRGPCAAHALVSRSHDWTPRGRCRRTQAVQSTWRSLPSSIAGCAGSPRARRYSSSFHIPTHLTLGAQSLHHGFVLCAYMVGRPGPAAVLADLLPVDSRRPTPSDRSGHVRDARTHRPDAIAFDLVLLFMQYGRTRVEIGGEEARAAGPKAAAAHVLRACPRTPGQGRQVTPRRTCGQNAERRKRIPPRRQNGRSA